MNMDLTLAENFYRQMLLIRRFEEKCVELYSKEKIRDSCIFISVKRQ